jgi:SAM-dependent methyltransferase
VGDFNQLAYVRRQDARLAPPYLEVGSRDHGSTQDLRAIFAARGEYVGADLEGGPGVDQVVDFALDEASVEAALGRCRFRSVFCLSVLEHCEQPFRMAENITRLLAPGGVVCISVPFAWKFHAYPSDYWRFTHEGVKKLFPELEFDMRDAVLATARDHEFYPIDKDLGRIQFGFSAHRRRGYPMRGVTAGLLKQLARLGLFRWLAGHRYLLAPTNILMLGVKRDEKSEAERSEQSESAVGALETR